MLFLTIGNKLSITLLGDFKMDMGERIKKIRKSKGWSQTELAEKIGITSGGLSGLEANKKDASKTTIIKLSEVLEVSADYLLTGKEGTNDISEDERLILETLREDKSIANIVMDIAKVKKKAISYLVNYNQPAMG